jgi:predicted component of type VI protein secretion system
MTDTTSPPITLTQRSPARKVLGTFTKSRIVIGKRPDCDVRLDGMMGIAARHAILEWRDGTLWVTDCWARTGVLLDGRRIDSNTPTPVAAGAEIRLGSVTLVAGHGSGSV